MLEIHLNMYHAVALAAAMFYVGTRLTKKISFLSKFCIPAPLVGGLCFAIVNTALYATGTAMITFDDTFGTLFMTMFFTAVGFSASIPALLKGGKFVFLILVLSIVVIVMQNFLGGGLMMLMGENPLYGIACGSLSLIGGPGTAAGIGPDLVKAGAPGATEIAIASAVFGMVCGSIISGPVARRLVVRNNLRSSADTAEYAKLEELQQKEVEAEDSSFTTDGASFVKGFLLMMLGIGVGDVVSDLLTSVTGISFPVYIGGMTMGLLIRNVMEFAHIDFPDREVDAIGSAAVNTFLAMTLCGLKLWVLADLALPMLVTLAVQAVMTAAMCYVVCFRMLGKDYDAAVMSAGFLGMAMGTASNAMASMQAVTNKFGPCVAAFFAVPVAGLFMDFANAAIIAANIVLWS